MFTYADLVAAQEQPELSPNEVAYRLSELLGLDHFLCHRALLAANPELRRQGEELVLHYPSLATVQAVLGPLITAEVALPQPLDA